MRALAKLASSPTRPTRALEWGDINIIHTTDTHGWLQGHTKASEPEPNYSGDFGDFASFVAHMKAQAAARGADLLLVDSGDLHDGNGLADVILPGGNDGHESNKLFAQLPYDVLAPAGELILLLPSGFVAIPDGLAKLRRVSTIWRLLCGFRHVRLQKTL